jgi:two-component system sensor histidine kinase BaeS
MNSSTRDPHERFHHPRNFRGWQRGESPPWFHKQRFLFYRFGRILGFGLFFFLVSIGGLAFLFSRLFGGNGQATLLVWLLGCGLALSFPILVGLFASRFFNGIINPLARVMAAADAVAEGDFSVRVPEIGPGEFGKLAQSFNRMVAELDRSDQLRRNLTADIAHELRTPLHIIQGNLEGILDGIYTPDSEHVTLLLDETRRLTRLVEDLRTLSLAEAGQLALDIGPVNVDEILTDVATSFSGQAETAGVSLRVVKADPSRPLTLQADAGRLDQVLGNLVANAIRHTPSGGEITLSAEAFGNEIAGGVRIRIADNGSGIPVEDLPYIFDRFWTGDRARRNNNELTSGLGLPIARQLVQAHGGTIRAESRVNQGTTFTIEMPANPKIKK